MRREVDPVAHPIRVLIADDQPATRRALRAVLAFYPGVECVGEAADGRQAVSLATEQRCDVVLMDARMPRMDGIEATRHIKTESPGINVVILTMYPECEDDALAAGADTFLVKGGPSDELRVAICNS